MECDNGKMPLMVVSLKRLDVNGRPQRCSGSSPRPPQAPVPKASAFEFVSELFC